MMSAHGAAQQPGMVLQWMNKRPVQDSDAPTCKRRRLWVKQTSASFEPAAPRMQNCGALWRDLHEGVFEDMTHRKKYKHVLNKLLWWFKGDPKVAFAKDELCSSELWQLARTDWSSLNKRQKNRVVRFFFRSHMLVIGS